MTCCDIHSVQHDNLCPINTYDKTSEFRKPYVKSRNNSTTAYSRNVEFVVSFSTLMSENLCDAYIFTELGLLGRV